MNFAYTISHSTPYFHKVFLLHSEQRFLPAIRIAWGVSSVAPKTVGGFCFVFIKSTDLVPRLCSLIPNYWNCKILLGFPNAVEPWCWDVVGHLSERCQEWGYQCPWNTGEKNCCYRTSRAGFLQAPSQSVLYLTPLKKSLTLYFHSYMLCM